ncbi:MAG: hypothetical protein U5L95_05495 [Candidatus Saccharibacteria bacterium]|nr:hypothetical protein [Candidatus Saccharibacteria bacterium]
MTSSQIKLLKALIPYTRENIQFTFTPNKFFNRLEAEDRLTQSASRNAFYRAKNKGLIVVDDKGIPRLTDKGHRKLAPYTAEKLKNSSLMIAFDIPEAQRWKRHQLRLFLREFHFKQVQRSVWTTDLDCKKYLVEEIRNLSLKNQAKIYECVELK